MTCYTSLLRVIVAVGVTTNIVSN